MQELVKLIKELEGKEVNTKIYLKEKAINDLAKIYGVPKDQQHVWNGPKDGELKDILIGGYGEINAPYGCGPSRLAPVAAYYLRLFAVKEHVKLFDWPGLAYALKSTVEEIHNHSHFSDRCASKPHKDGDHLVLASAYVNKTSMNFSGIITNVRKEGLSHWGDISLYIVKSLGHGTKYLSAEEQRNFGMLRTIDLLSGRNVLPWSVVPFGNELREQIIYSKRQMNTFTDSFSIGSDYKIWMLTVDNTYR
jgi:hypothetical protein